MQIIALTGTIPPLCVRLYHQLLDRPDFTIFRQPSDRHNLSLHYIPAHRRPSESYSHEDVVLELIANLQALPNVTTDPADGTDRILVFFPNTKHVQSFATANDFLWYHSKEGSKLALKDVLAAWDNGPCNVLVASTAMAQGLDRSNVRYVIMVEMHYGISLLAQMMGRAGRDGFPSATYFIGHKSNMKDEDMGLFSDPGTCYRQTMTDFLDGEQYSFCCLNSPYDVLPCGHCKPNSKANLVGLKAVSDAKEAIGQALYIPPSTRAPRDDGVSLARPCQPPAPSTTNALPTKPSMLKLAMLKPPAPVSSGSKCLPSTGSSAYWGEEGGEISAEVVQAWNEAEQGAQSVKARRANVCDAFFLGLPCLRRLTPKLSSQCFR